MKRTEHFFKMFAHYWNLYTRTGGMEPLERLAYADKTFDALLAWECGVDVPPEDLTPFARALIDKRLADGKARADRFHKSPTESLQRPYRNPTGGQQRPYRNPTEALQDASREPTGNQQRTEIEREKESWGFQPQHIQSNPTQPNAHAGEPGPTATQGPQDARREPQAADPTPPSSPPSPPRPEPQRAAPVGGISGQVQTVLQSVGMDRPGNKTVAEAVSRFLSNPKETVWNDAELPDNALPAAAAVYFPGDRELAERGYRNTMRDMDGGAKTFRAELGKWIAEDAAGENRDVRDPGRVFHGRLKKHVPAEVTA